ncbi:hypothetical protein K8T06_13530 [bacterium]|nr:hypothetical protein [bacterium]
MNEFPLSLPDCEKILYRTAFRNVLSEAVRPAEVILCVGRAYQSLGHMQIPDIIETEKLYFPFYVFRTDCLMRIMPAVGLPYRLFTKYQFKFDSGAGKGQIDEKYNAQQPDVSLEIALHGAGPEFTEIPTQTRVSIVFVPFYKVLIKRGKATANILINAYNADVLLEQPPPQWSRKSKNSSIVTAVFAFSGLVALITSTWVLTGYMIASLGVTILAGWVIRKLVLRSCQV